MKRDRGKIYEAGYFIHERELTGGVWIDYNLVIITILRNMTQKVLKVGKSAAVTIPKEILEEMRLKTGDQVTVEFDKKKRSVVIRANIEIDTELLDCTENFIEEYRPALEALAKK